MSMSPLLAVHAVGSLAFMRSQILSALKLSVPKTLLTVAVRLLSLCVCASFPLLRACSEV